MPLVTFTVRRGLGAAEKPSLSEAMLDAQVAAGFERGDLFHRFVEVGQDDLLADARFPDYPTDRTGRFMVVEIVISRGRPAGTGPVGVRAAYSSKGIFGTGQTLTERGGDILLAPSKIQHSSNTEQ